MKKRLKRWLAIFGVFLLMSASVFTSSSVCAKAEPEDVSVETQNVDGQTDNGAQDGKNINPDGADHGSGTVDEGDDGNPENMEENNEEENPPKEGGRPSLMLGSGGPSDPPQYELCLSISYDGEDEPENYSVSFETVGDIQGTSIDSEETGAVSKDESSKEFTVASAFVKITVSDAGKDIYCNNQKDDGWRSGRVVNLAADETSYAFTLKDPSQQGGTGGDGGSSTLKVTFSQNYKWNEPNGYVYYKTSYESEWTQVTATINDPVTAVAVRVVPNENYQLEEYAGVRCNGQELSREEMGGITGEVGMQLSNPVGSYELSNVDFVPNNQGNPGDQGDGDHFPGETPSSPMIAVQFDDGAQANGKVQYKATSDDGWEDISDNVNKSNPMSAVAVRVVPNSGYSLDQWCGVFKDDQSHTFVADSQALSSQDGVSLTENGYYVVEHVCFNNGSNPGPNPGPNPQGQPGIRWHDLGDSGKVQTVQYSLNDGADWNSMDSGSVAVSIEEGTKVRLRVCFNTAPEGESYQVDAGNMIGLLKFENVNADDSGRLFQKEYRFGGSEETGWIYTPTEGFVEALGSEEGVEITFKPEADSMNADGHPAIPANAATLVLQFNVRTVYSSGGSADVYTYTQFGEPGGGYGIYTEIGGSWDYYEGVLADSEGIEMSFNTNNFSTGIDPGEHGFGGDGEEGDTIRYTSAHGSDSGRTVDGPVFSYVKFSGVPTMDGDTNSITIKDSLMAEGWVIYSVEGENKDFTSGAIQMTRGEGGCFTCSDLPKAAEYRVLIRKSSPTEHRLYWQYTDSFAQGYVDHGKIFVEEIKRDDTVILGNISKSDDGSIIVDEQGIPSYGIDLLTDLLETQLHLQKWRITNGDGFFWLEDGDVVTVKLIPTYGYQIRSVNLSGMNLTPQDSKSTFTFTVNGNMELAGSFVQSSDQMSITSSKVSGAEISNGENAVDTGNLKLSISDNSSYAKTEDAKTQALSGTGESEAQTLATLDLNLDNIVSKGNDEYWTEPITDFPNAINVELAVPGVENGQIVKVIRDHEGTLTTLDASYNPATGKVSFPTNQFSTYSVVVLGEAEPTPTPTSSPSPSGDPSKKPSGEGNTSSETAVSVPAAAPINTVAVTVGGTIVTQKDTKDNVAVMVGGTKNGAKISEWNELATYLASPQTAPLAAQTPQTAVSLAKPIELVLCKKNTVVPEIVFDSLAVNPAPSLHVHIRDGVAINFFNDPNLLNQKAVDLKCTITAPKGYAKRIAFNSDAKLFAITSIHATVPKSVKSVNVYTVDKKGKRTLLWANVPVVDGRYCFLINQLGIFEIEY